MSTYPVYRPRGGMNRLLGWSDDFMSWFLYGHETWLVAVLKAVPLFLFMYFVLFYVSNYIYYLVTVELPFLRFSEDVENTVEAGAEIYATAGCVTCHAEDLSGTTAGPDITGIGSGLVDLSGFATPTDADQMETDYDADPRAFLEQWIRDSAGNYGASGMPPHPEGTLSDPALQALITFLLEGDH